MWVYIKEFPFPSYGIWMNRISKETFGRHEMKIGDYSCCIGISSFDSSGNRVYKCAISKDDPFNMYSDTIFCVSQMFNSDEVKELQQWYDDTALRANSAFNRYIQNQYLIQCY